MLRRRLSIASALVSLLLLAATILLWLRSGQTRDVFTLRYAKQNACWIESVRSGIQFVAEGNTFAAYTTGWESVQPADTVVAKTYFGFGGVNTAIPLYSPNESARNVQLIAVVVPYYGLIAATALAPLLWLLTFVLRRPLPCHCTSCGYDLRASIGRCPECGAPIPGKVSA